MNPEFVRSQILDLVRQYCQEKFSTRSFEPGKDLVHYAGRFFDAEEMVALVDSSLDFFLTANRYAERFESEFAEYLDVSNAMLVNSGSSANLVALTALTSPKLGDRRLKPGDEVITTACGFPTTLNPILQNQLIPVFVDVNLGDYTAVPDQLVGAIGPNTRAIMMAHTMGVPFGLDVVTGLAKKYDLWVVEDCCDALGSLYSPQLSAPNYDRHPRKVGTFGHLSTFSFYPAHHITMGEGGCIATDDEELARIARSVRDWGRDCYCSGGENNTCGKRFSKQFGTLPFGYDHKYVYSHIGYNLKVTDMQAAVGWAQFQKLEHFMARRKENFRKLNDIIRPYEQHLILPRATAHSDPSWFGYVITVRDGAPFTRNDLTRFLEASLIETRNLFSGNLLCHPAYQGIQCRVAADLTNTNTVMTNTFFIGVYPGITDRHLSHVADAFSRFMNGERV